MSVRDDIRQALHDAIGWQEGLVDSWGLENKEGRDAAEQIKRYKKILKRRYGHDRTTLDDIVSAARPIGLDELRTKKN